MGNDKKLLVIDDEAVIRRVVEIKFKKRGYQVIMARDGQEGLNVIKTQHPDVVITDINMPKLDGKRLCEQTNDLKKERPFLTIVMTCQIDSDDHNWIKEMRDTEFMEKPFSPSKLLECVDRYFHIKR
ncbi:MAG: response regulator [Desulfobacterales bacterium]|nr:response regulator [Desulfobacterales bacterium]